MTEVPIIPMERIGEESWRRLEIAADDPAHPMRLLTLATVDVDDRPDARLMVLRGADRSESRLWLHTNPTSPKLDQIRARPCVCLVAWDPRDGVQLRVCGKATSHGGGHLHARHVEQLRTRLERLDAEPGERDEADLQRDPRSEHFLGLSPAVRSVVLAGATVVIDIHVDVIEWMQATERGLRRARMRADDGFIARSLTPPVMTQGPTISVDGRSGA